ncbi:FAD-dependent oxidoreductase [Salidesulfovibrio brasiliensis]|uniref:FAD-dependent oxidoreductase n=1 Tax=Salidesulfovibrio brasiliensis TaxID=221711 RepID=UPI0006D2B161|nr:FAD-dependent oxidoreductase [Salidesulfovibrio brasiliensis]
MRSPDVIILGAGAAGLYCAIHAARSGLSVTMLDHADKPARKVRVSGGGRCNFTNLDAGPEDYASNNPHFAKSALARHTPWDAVAFFAECGLTYEEKAAGQLFCEQKAGRLAGELVDRARKAGVELLTGQPIESVEGHGPFTVRFGGRNFTAPKLVVALGGPSWPQVGATDRRLQACPAVRAGRG